MKYINKKAVTKLIQSYGKRAGKDFLLSLDVHIENRIRSACEVHNGGKKTLDSSVAGYVGIR